LRYGDRVHLSADHPLDLASSAKIRPAVESRLASLPAFLAQGALCLREPVPLWTKLARQSCAGAEAFLREVGEQLAAVSPEPEKTRSLISGAIAAFRKYADAAEAKPPGVATGYSIGREGFEFLLREKTGLSYSLPEVRALGEDLVARLGAELQAGVAQTWTQNRHGSPRRSRCALETTRRHLARGV
jgi:hypothetical protein